MINKSLLIVLALGLGLGLVLALLALLGEGLIARAAPVAELHVCPSDCVYSSIQAAVDAAQEGAVIKVAQGTYTDVYHLASMDTSAFTATQSVAITKSITLQGGYTATDWNSPDPEVHPTIIDAGGLGRVMVISGTISPVIEGFHLTGGNSDGLGGKYVGDVGGGIFISSASPLIISNQIYSNTATWYGGGLYLLNSSATISNNIIAENTTQHRGGGLYLDSAPFNSFRTIISGNTIRGNVSGIRGGGISSYWSEVTLNGNRFESNTAADQGGGLDLNGHSGVLNGNAFIGNQAKSGGGIYLNYYMGNGPTLINTVLVGNQASEGSGIWFGGHEYPTINTVRALQTTLYDNGGGGEGIFIGEYASLALTNTIIMSHTVGISLTTNSTTTLDSTLWYANETKQSGSITHINDHTGDPILGADGFHIGPNSAARDAGVNSGVYNDIDGERRPQGVGYDIGADEFDLPAIYLPLVIKTNS